jgi:hypothetical protein
MSLASQVNLLATRVATEVKAVRADISATDFHTDWGNRANATAISSVTGDDGQPFVIDKLGTGVLNPDIVSGYLVGTDLPVHPGAVYMHQVHTQKIKWMGATFKFGATGAAGTSIAFVAFSRTGVGNSTGLRAHVHWSVGSTTHDFGVIDSDGVVTSLLSESLPMPLTADVEYTAEVFVEGSTAYLFLPGGQLRVVTDARIGSNTGVVACTELYQPTTGLQQLYVRRTWAHPYVGLPGFLGALQAYRILNGGLTSGLGVQTVAGVYTFDGTAAGDLDITALADVQLYAATTGTPYGRKKLISVYASGATRTVSVHSSIVAVGGATTSFSVAAGKSAVFGLRYNPLANIWHLLASGVSA